MKYREYLWRQFKEAYGGPFRIMERIEIWFTILGGSVCSFWPGALGPMTFLLWAVPLVAFVATFVVSFAIAAPWKIQQESEAENIKLRCQLERAAGENALLKMDVAILSSTAAHLYHESVGSDLEFHGWKYRLSEISTRIQHIIAKAFGPDEVVMMVTARRYKALPTPDSFNSEHNELRCQIDQVYIPTLKDIHARLSRENNESH